MESEIKIGQRFEFAVHADEGLKQKAIVARVLSSNRKEGLGPEFDFYIAQWMSKNSLGTAKSAGLRAGNRGERLSEWPVG
jgi:hypothetical protein